MRYTRRVSRIPVLLCCALFMTWTAQAFAGSPSSCVQCHLDEDMLEESLAEVKAKKSAMQSGAG